MNNTLKTILIVLAVLFVAGGLFSAGMFFAGRQTGSQYGYWGMPMMGGYGWGNNTPGYGGGPMMNGGRGYGPGYTSNAQPLSADEARQAAQKFVDGLGIRDLSLGEVMIFDNNAYVAVKETSTGTGAFELLVDPVSKIAYPEVGPNMMWNLKYGGVNRGQMMGGYGWNPSGTVPTNVSADMPVTADQAVKAAQDYLDRYLSGDAAATDPLKFYGYYTLDFSRDGKVVGMLSVNGYSGQVFVHTWHGTFVEEAR